MVPVFLDGQGGNHLYVQEIGSEDRIAGFEPVTIGRHEVQLYDAALERQVGDSALWAFQPLTGPCVIDERAALRPMLMAIRAHVSPLLRLQFSNLYDEEALPEDITEAYQSMLATAPRSAALWRDLTILLPRIRRIILSLPHPNNAKVLASVKGIHLHAVDDRLLIEIPSSLIEMLGGEDALRSLLSRLQTLFAAFGLVQIDITDTHETSIEDNPASPNPADLTVIRCGAEEYAKRSNQLYDVHYLNDRDLFDQRGVLVRDRLPHFSKIVLLQVEATPRTVQSATVLSAELGQADTLVATLVVPSAQPSASTGTEADTTSSEVSFDGLFRNSHWLAFVGDEAWDSSSLHSDPEPMRPHFSQVTRWVPHALRACLLAEERGTQAIRLLRAHAGAASVRTASARGDNAAELATQAALASSKNSLCPALSAHQLVLVAFHNRNLEAETRRQIEECARLWNPAAELAIVEEPRDDMTKRVRVVVFARGQHKYNHPGQHRRGEEWRHPPHLTPLFQAGWKMEPQPYHRPSRRLMISKGEARYLLHIETDLVIDQKGVEEIEGLTPMHQGIVALLVRAVTDPRAQQRLLEAGIFCVTVEDPGMLERYGNAPGKAIKAALIGRDRTDICNRLRRLIGDRALTGLWGLDRYWGRDSPNIYVRWQLGHYNRIRVLENLQFHRVTKDGTWYFRGIVGLNSTREDVPRLRYRFGVALDQFGLRLIRLEPVAGEHDVKAEIRPLLDTRQRKRLSHHRKKSSDVPADGIDQLSLNLGD